jgi:hypothetical protein
VYSAATAVVPHLYNTLPSWIRVRSKDPYKTIIYIYINVYNIFLIYIYTEGASIMGLVFSILTFGKLIASLYCNATPGKISDNVRRGGGMHGEFISITSPPLPLLHLPNGNGLISPQQLKN